MKKTVSSALVLFMMLIASIHLLAIEKTEITGIIQPLEVDGDGAVIAIILEADDDNFIVVPGEANKVLLTMVGKTVTLKGLITRDREDNQATIQVNTWHLGEASEEIDE